MTQRSGRFTKGLWQVRGPSSGWGAMDDGGDYAVYVERDNTKHIIAEVICKTRENNCEPAEANARLIIAAQQAATAAEDMGYDGQAAVEALPRLLEKLEGIEEYFEQRGDAEYLPGIAAPQGNEEMTHLMEIQEALTACRSKEPSDG